MNPKFERFLKETKEDQLKKERLERKAQKLALKQIKLAAEEEAKKLKALAKEEKLKQKEEAKKEKALAKLNKAENKSKKSQESKLIELTSGSEASEISEISWESQDLFSTNVVKSEPVQIVGIEDPEPKETASTTASPSASAPPSTTASEPAPTSAIEKAQVLQTQEPVSLYEMFATEGDYKWLQPDCPATKAAFNLMNKSLHPDRPLAKGIAVLAVKGTSFDDKRLNALESLSQVKAKESSGEIELIPEPQNPFDSNAVAVYDLETKKVLGYIPKAHDINACYSKALQEEKFCGGYIIEGKKSKLKGEDNAMILIATGWL